MAAQRSPRLVSFQSRFCSVLRPRDAAASVFRDCQQHRLYWLWLQRPFMADRLSTHGDAADEHHPPTADSRVERSSGCRATSAFKKRDDECSTEHSGAMTRTRLLFGAAVPFDRCSRKSDHEPPPAGWHMPTGGTLMTSADIVTTTVADLDHRGPTPPRRDRQQPVRPSNGTTFYSTARWPRWSLPSCTFHRPTR